MPNSPPIRRLPLGALTAREERAAGRAWAAIQTAAFLERATAKDGVRSLRAELRRVRGS